MYVRASCLDKLSDFPNTIYLDCLESNSILCSLFSRAFNCLFVNLNL